MSSRSQVIATVAILAAFTTGRATFALVTNVTYIDGFTGSDPNTAKECFRGVEVFLHEHPRAMARLSIEKLDDGGDINLTLERLNKRKQPSKIVIGYSKSDRAVAAAQYAATNSMLFIGCFTTNAQVTRDRPLAFQMPSEDTFQARVLEKFASQVLKKKKILILRNVGTVYSLRLVEEFQKHTKTFSKKTTTHVLDYDGSKLDGFHEQLITEVQKFNPDLVFIPDYVMTAGVIAKLLHAKFPSIPFLGSDGWGGRRIFETIFQQNTGIEAYYSTLWHESIATSTTRNLIKAYAKLYPGDTATSGSAMGYDMMTALWMALQSAKNPNDTKELATILRRSTFVGTTGPLSFGPENNPTRPIPIVKFKNGTYSLAGVYTP